MSLSIGRAQFLTTLTNCGLIITKKLNGYQSNIASEVCHEASCIARGMAGGLVKPCRRAGHLKLELDSRVR